jgi:hypothetical protein
MNWRYDLSSKAPALLVQSPNSNPSPTKQEKEKKKLEIIQKHIAQKNEGTLSSFYPWLAFSWVSLCPQVTLYMQKLDLSSNLYCHLCDIGPYMFA